MNGRTHARRYAALLLVVVVLATLAAALVNTRVDPWRVVGAPWADPALDPHRDISAATRTGKAGLVRARSDWEAAIFGSSRVISALDPRAPGWAGAKVVNLGMPGAFLHENLAMADYFLDRQCPATLIFGIDPGDLTSPLDTRPMSDFRASPLQAGGAVDRELRYVVGLATFEASMETLALKRRNQPGEYNAYGLRDRPRRGGGEGGGGKGQLEFITNRFIDDARVARQESGDVDPDKARKLEALMLRCRERGVRLVLFLQPNHVLLSARSEDLGGGGVPFEADRRALVGMVGRVNAGDRAGPPVELWDFQSFHPINRERVRPLEGRPNALVHWRDLEHFTKDVGEAMLATMMGWRIENPELQGYGERIDAASLEARLAGLRQAYQTYLREEAAGDVAWKEALSGGS
jgi:hypothetical protein